MTTTVFRKNDKNACIACDSRVSWINKQGLPIKIFDSLNYFKALTLDGVMYGFAGANLIFKEFLKNYESKEQSIFLLDTLVQLAKDNTMQFFMIRYENNELKLFAHSPALPVINSPEIFRISKDPAIEKKFYAIGSGKFSKEYNRNKLNPEAQVPIRCIIRANNLGLKKQGMLELIQSNKPRELTSDESLAAYQACDKKGGDIFTGGEVRMTKHESTCNIEEQIKVMNDMDEQAKAANAVCASPVNANLEVAQLERIGHYAVSSFSIDNTPDRTSLLQQLQQNISHYI